MPLREKAKSFFKSKHHNSDSLSKTNTNGSDRKGSDYYQPGEMPLPKYRRPPQKEHKEKLEAFSFADAWGRKSFQSHHSPMGTRAPSRRASWMSMGRKSVASLPRKSLGGRSIGGRSEAGRSASAASVDIENSGARQQNAMGAAVIPTLTVEPEQDGDDDVANVGLSKVQTAQKIPPSRPKTADAPQTNGVKKGLHTTLSTAPDHQPFTGQDIALALARSRTPTPAQP